MNQTTMLLIAGGAVLLIVLAVVALLLDQANKARRTRIETLLKPYSLSTVREARAPKSAPTAVVASAQTPGILRMAGVRLHRSDLYPMPWWLLLLLCGAVATGGALLAVAVVGKFGWLSQPVIWLVLSRVVFGTFIARRARLLYSQMPDALAMIVRSVRSGIPVQEALRIVGREALAPTAEEFEKLYNQLVIGQTLPEALSALAKRAEVKEYRFFAVALSLQAQTGGSLTDTLENLADVIRKRVAARARAHALSSEARMTMFMLAALPMVAAAALAVITPDYVLLLVNSPRGRAILGVAVLMLLMGMGSMQYLIKKALT